MMPFLRDLLSDDAKGLTFLLREVGADVVMTYSGRLDLTGATLRGSYTYSSSVKGAVKPGSGLIVGHVASATTKQYHTIGNTPFGAGSSVVLGDTSSGDATGLDASGSDTFAVVPGGYVSRAPLSGEVTFLGETFASLGLTPGTYVTELDIADGASPDQKIHMKVT